MLVSLLSIGVEFSVGRCMPINFDMRLGGLVGTLMFVLSPMAVNASGVSPYLPLDLSPTMERQIERALILAGTPVMRRPIPAAIVLEALPRICAQDPSLCEQLREYLKPYMRDAAVTQATVELSSESGDSVHSIPNAHGELASDHWRLAGGGYYQPTDYVLLNVGGVAYSGNTTLTGTTLSVGSDWAQVDVGYQDHWLSPSADGGFLIGTQAPTLPSISVSNYRPLTSLGLGYQMFLAQMPKSDDIAYPGGTTSGHPNLLGLQAEMAPVPGYALAINRLLQYGGGAREQAGLAGLKNALFHNSSAQTPDSATTANEFGNQVASITGSYIHPGPVPFEFRFEYAGEDNLYSAGYRLGKIVLALGFDFPQLGDHYDASYDVSERQDTWYVNHLYGDGLTNDGHVIGHWFGDDRLFGDSPGGYTQSLKVGRRADDGSYWQWWYRNESNWRFSAFSYHPLHEFGLAYTNGFWGRTGSTNISVGQDVFGKHFVRVAASVDLARPYQKALPSGAASAWDSDTGMFVDVGLQKSKVHKIYWDGLPDVTTERRWGEHFGLGVRRSVTDHGDVGVRLEFDRIDAHDLLSIRIVDYRYRMGSHIGIGAFFGAARYRIDLPAWGYYWGAGLQYRDVLPKWDAGIDVRHHEKISRNNLLPTDRGVSVSTVSFRDVNGLAFYASRRF